LRERHVREIRSRFRAKSVADLAVTLLSILWLFAKETLAMQLGPNPTVDVLTLHRKAKPHEPWPGEIIEKFKLEAGAVARLALLLLLYTGQRVGDVAAMRWDRYDGEGISVRQHEHAALDTLSSSR
jgi:integrase